MTRAPSNGSLDDGRSDGRSDDGRSMDTQALSSLTFRVRRSVEGLLGGVHPSVHFGASLEFEEHKRYHPGDDLRHVDWNALARTDRFFVKQQQREVVLNAQLVIDCSASMGYRGERATQSKLRYAADLLAAAATVLLRQGDAAGMLAFGSTLNCGIAAGRRPDQLSMLMRRFAEITPDDGGPTAYGSAVSRIARLAGRRALILLATDLWGTTEETEAALAQLAAKGHDIAIFHVLDPDESDLPFTRPVQLTGMENEGARHVDPALIREDYREAVAEFVGKWRRFCREHRMDFISATTDRPAAAVLSEFASARRGGRRLQ